MNENIGSEPDGDDAAFDRLRAADRAGGIEPDRGALDSAVRARLAAPGDELAGARARRGRGAWLSVAAVAAGALVFGSAGYALGTAGSQGGDAPTAGGVISLGEQGSSEQGAGQLAPGTEQAPGTGQAQSAAEPDVGTGSDAAVRSSMIYPGYGYGGRTVFTADGLSEQAGSAEAWAYDPAAVFSADTAALVAAALGLEGSPALVDGAWSVGPNDGSAPSLQLQPDGQANLNFYDPTVDPYNCPVSEPGVAEPDASTSNPDNGAVPLPGPPKVCVSEAVGPAPQGDAAIAAAKDLLGKIGVDTAGFEFETQESGDTQWAYVTAHQVVAGERTGAAWSIGLVGAGVQSLGGPLAPTVSLGMYDVVSAQAAVDRLADPRFGAGYGGPLMYAQEGVAMDAGAAAEGSVAQESAASSTREIQPAPTERTLPPAVAPGSAFSWPVNEVALTSARLGLTLHWQADGSTVLVPAYALSSADGQTWSVIAVADSQLDFSAAS